jgi:hypothetical protein
MAQVPKLALAKRQKPDDESGEDEQGNPIRATLCVPVLGWK